MFRINVFKLSGILAAIVVALALFAYATASHYAFGGELKDNLWDITTRYCRDGFTVSATQTQLSVQRINNQPVSFWLELAASRLPVKTSLPSTIASGDGSSLVNAGRPVTATFLFDTLQAPATPISITIERWDHGQQTAKEEDEDSDIDKTDDEDHDGDSVDNNIDNDGIADHDADSDDTTDESTSDDIIYDPGITNPSSVTAVEDCLLSDTTAPVATETLSPGPNANGWNNANVTVQLNATDESGGSGVKEITYTATGAQPIGSTTVSGDSTSLSIGAEGQTTITYFARDKSGNVETPQTVTVKIDQTAPALSGSRAPGANSHGWNNSDVTVSFACSDTLSGVDVPPLSPQILSTEGPGQSLVGTCADKAGNTASATVSGINIDKTAPSISITSPQAQDYAHTASVTMAWTTTDPLSGVASQGGTLDGTTVTQGQIVDLFFLSLGSHTVVINALDIADNAAAPASVTFKVVATIDSLIDGTQRACSSLGWISKKGTCDSLGAKLQAAKAALARGQTMAARNALNAYLAELKAQRGLAVNQQAYALLTADAQYLLDTLPASRTP